METLIDGCHILSDIPRFALDDCPERHSVFATGTVAELVAAGWWTHPHGLAPDTKVVATITPLADAQRVVTVLHLTAADLTLDRMIACLQALKAR